MTAGEGFASGLAREGSQLKAGPTPDLRVMSVDPESGVLSIFLRCCGVTALKCLGWIGLVRANPPQQSPHTKWCIHGRMVVFWWGRG